LLRLVVEALVPGAFRPALEADCADEVATTLRAVRNRHVHPATKSKIV